MDEAKLLLRLRSREPAALEDAIGTYGAYVAAILRKEAIGGALPGEDFYYIP